MILGQVPKSAPHPMGQQAQFLAKSPRVEVRGLVRFEGSCHGRH